MMNRKEHSRVEDVGGVVHALLEGAVEVGEGLGGAREAHVLAEVVAALGAVAALAALDARLDRDALADEVFTRLELRVVQQLRVRR